MNATVVSTVTYTYVFCVMFFPVCCSFQPG